MSSDTKFGVPGSDHINPIEWEEHVEINGVGSKKVTVVSATGNAVETATSINQDTLNSLVETLQELTTRLSSIAGTVGNTQQLRVVQTSVPSTAVTGPITSAQSIAEKAVAGILYPEKMAITNLTAVQSNINNCIGA